MCFKFAKLFLAVLYGYTFFYPIIMSIIWITGGITHWFIYEHNNIIPFDDIDTEITILVPCHNEGKTIAPTCKSLLNLDYSSYKVIFIDDGSTDDTVDILREFTNMTSNYHLLIIEDNKGKAHALNIALELVKSDFVLIIDADTIIRQDALQHYLRPFKYHDNLGAVTGNPIPINRNTLFAKFQTAEFMSIIGLIKRTQHLWGRIFTVSGCATAYRTSELKVVGGFSTNTATEDIDVTWKLQRSGKQIYFEPLSTVCIQVPNRFIDYWKQRKRWAMGGWHLLRNHRAVTKDRGNFQLKAIYYDLILSYTWGFCLILSTLMFPISLTVCQDIKFIDVVWCTSILISLCILQMYTAIAISKFYDDTLHKTFVWVPWYALLFYIISAILIVYTSKKGLFGSQVNAGKWSSPVRSLE